MTSLTKSQLLLNTLLLFYQKDENLKKILPITLSNSKISLRILDYFVTNYSKDNNIIIKNNNTVFSIYNDYKLQLKAYNKKYFDPFCRGVRSSLIYNNKKIETTIGQLNFFRWALTNNIIDYVSNNLESITKKMNIDYQQKKLRNSTTNTATTLTETTPSSMINQHENIRLIIDFDD